ncbi:hypothetical protein Sipo8835_42730 [Streptomyces ipomoeae]|uniref:PE-PGRS family protein n=2 Tax=Streptomyces ipomoeae TaxID=103232 RepID=A0AAE8VVJ8_9ACTN|nr:hypothetical protein Sipo8835_42730 [Streptomyces ipomoeae]TQE36457.1 hypothetical protein Sipo7851_12100 [Streptomyces ipomoeae]
MFAAVCVLLAALGHVMMSGSHVPWWAMVAGAAATGTVGWSLAGRERGLPLIVSVVVAAQTALHSGFSWAQSSSPTGAGVVEGMASTGGLGSMGSMRSMGTGSGPMDHTVHTASTGQMGHADHIGHLLDGPYSSASSSGMFAAHLLAALLCGLWLAYGERALFGLLRAVAGWLAAPLRLSLALSAPPERPRPRVRRGRRSDRSPRRLLLVHAITSRGPPAGAAVI